jgi:hypothetical protein
MIRAPKVMMVAFGVMKHVMNESTREKVRESELGLQPSGPGTQAWCDQMQILGDDYMAAVTKYVAPDQIPQSYGGTCACLVDPNCSSK